jgi:CheY-like chemotaxis protein
MARILVVDDNLLVRTLLAQVLRGAGYDVVEAPDGNRALALAKTHLPDLVITDFYMPEMDGAEFVKLIRSDHSDLKDVPIIGLAGTTDSERKLVEAGVNVYLPKPLREPKLLETIKAALKK